MKKTMCLIFLWLVPISFVPQVASSNEVMTVLWPEIKPYQSGYLRVSDIHRIYYEVSGNPKGVPLFFIHGGPGASSSPRMRRYANPEKFMIVIHDQRGAGRSIPLGEIRENTTQNLVADIEQLRKELKVNRIILAGGSWGTTLALLYAETYPQKVAGLVLRGVFTATKSEIDHIFHGGVTPFFPEVYEDFRNTLPDPDVRPLPAYLYNLLRTDDMETRQKIAKAWDRYTLRIGFLVISEKKVEELVKSYDSFTLACFESYYMSRGAFLEEGQILRDAHRIAHIPTVIINGRYDLICPPETAFRLHRTLPKSRLIIVEGAGHMDSELAMEKALVEAIDSFQK